MAITIYLYSTLTALEAQVGIDFSIYNESWSPTDAQLYSAVANTESMISRASATINGYTGTTFSNHSSDNCPENVIAICNNIVMRAVVSRNNLIQAMGHSSFGDEFASFGGEFDTEAYLLTEAEKKILDKETIAMGINVER